MIGWVRFTATEDRIEITVLRYKSIAFYETWNTLFTLYFKRIPMIAAELEIAKGIGCFRKSRSFIEICRVFGSYTTFCSQH
jgi:hypothetical protein